MSAAAWRLAVRAARRDAWRHRGRSLLVITLLGLPVLFVSAAAVLHRTWQLDPTTRLDREIGQSDARVYWVPYANLDQDVDGTGSSWNTIGSPPPRPTTADLIRRLPAGSRVIEFRQAPEPVRLTTASDVSDAPLTGLDYADPLATGIVRQVSGRAPRTASEVVVTARTADDASIGVGDPIRLLDPARSVTVVGIVETANAANAPGLYALPATVAVPPGATDSTGGAAGELGWLVDSPRPITWEEVRAWNAAGFVTTSRSVVMHPPPLSQQSYVETSSSNLDVAETTTAAIVVGMALLEVVLLAGPAFAVGGRRKERELALLGAIGGGPADLRRAVLADALGLGLLGGIAGAAGGIGLAALLTPHVERLAGDLPGRFTVPWMQVAGLTVVAVVTALAAAALPARRAGRTDVVGALAGRRPDRPVRARMPILGLALAVAGTLVAVGSDSGPIVTTGVVLLEGGLIVATPWLLTATGRLARWLPVSGRIALRDASRQRSAATPAVAAVMTAVIGATAAMIGVASRQAGDDRNYEAQLPRRDTYIDLMKHQGDASAAVAAARRAVPGAATIEIFAPRGLCGYLDDFGPQAGSCLSVTLPGDWESRASGHVLPNVVIDDGSAVQALFGAPAPTAVAALRSGRVVVPSPLPERGKNTLVVARGGFWATGSPSASVGTTVVRDGFPPAVFVLPPSVAAQLHLTSAPAGVLLTSSTGLTPAQDRALTSALAPLGLNAITETGPHVSSRWLAFGLAITAAILAVAAALIATALASVEGRPDLVVLAAIGAAPATRRRIAGNRAFAIAGIGAAIGTVAGLVPAQAWAAAVDSPLSIPWSLVLATAVGIPAVAGAIAWLGAGGRASTPGVA